MAFECPDCGMVSHHPEDERHGFCAACDSFPEQRPQPRIRLRPWVDPGAFLGRLEAEAGIHFARAAPGGKWVGLMRLMYTTAIVRGRWGVLHSHDERWCYHRPERALVALLAWDGAGDPKGWHRHPSSGRRVSESPDEIDGEDRRVGAVGVEYVRW